MAHDMVAEHEHKTGVDFRRVVMSRVDMDFLAPVVLEPARPVTPADTHACSSGLGCWYTCSNPPDGFWVMPRRVAERALQTAVMGKWTHLHGRSAKWDSGTGC